MSAYREHRPPAALRPVVACVWKLEPVEDAELRVVPDGCVDLIWLAEDELVFAGPDTGPRVVGLPGRRMSSGIRLRPGAAGAVLGLPASELRDRQVPAVHVWGEQAVRLQRLLAAADPPRRLELLAEAVARRGAVPDPLVIAAWQRLAAPGVRISDVAAELGVSIRQLHRRVVTAVGYGPKTLARVARLRRLVALGEESLALRALDAGYASQAHMNDDVRRLTGTTPVRFLEDAVLTAA